MVVSVRRSGRLVLFTLRGPLTEAVARQVATALRAEPDDGLSVVDLLGGPAEPAALDLLTAAVAARLSAGAQVVVVNPPSDAVPLLRAVGALPLATRDGTAGTGGQPPRLPDQRLGAV